MKTRILTAIVLLSFLSILLCFYNYKFCLAVIIVISSLIQVEWEFLMRHSLFNTLNKNNLQIDDNKHKKFDIIISIAMFISNTFILFFILDFCIKKFDGLSVLVIVGLIGILWLISSLTALFKPIGSLSNLSKQFFYRILPNLTSIALVFSCVIILNHIWIGKISLLLFVLPLVWLTDSLAYFIGRKFGKRKLAANISPKKTFEGAIGGVLLANITIGILYYLNSGYFSVILFMYFLGLSILSVIGDLFQSRLKREFNIKDSSQLLPGHGGLFDRFDAAIPVILFAVYFPDYKILENIVKPITGWI